MQHTANYSLPQWEAGDRVTRADFNTAMSAIDAAIAGSAGAVGALPRIVLGSYVGTGEYGSDHPNSLTFGFTPKLLLFFTTSEIVYRMSNDASSVIGITWGHTEKLCEGDQSNGMNMISYSGSTISWYNVRGASYQRNSQGQTYYYVAIG